MNKKCILRKEHAQHDQQSQDDQSAEPAHTDIDTTRNAAWLGRGNLFVFADGPLEPSSPPPFGKTHCRFGAGCRNVCPVAQALRLGVGWLWQPGIAARPDMAPGGWPGTHARHCTAIEALSHCDPRTTQAFRAAGRLAFVHHVY